MSSGTEQAVVYVVEDDDSVRRSLGRLLRAAGYDARLYADSERFLAEVKPMQEACIILDITMPRVGGLAIQSRLRGRGILLPVIVVTARDDEATRRGAIESGAMFCFRKPVDDHILIDAIERAVHPAAGQN